MNSNADDIPMNSISDDMLKEFRTAFNMLDSNNDGKLSVLDTISLLRQLNITATEPEIIEYFTQLQIEEGDQISFADFIKMVAEKTKEMSTVEELLNAFKVFDLDNSGTITVPEFRYIMSNYGMNFSDEDIDEMIKDADPANNGIIIYQDFVKLMKA